MSFRSRLRVFFTIIVVVPMAAVALVLFTITADSETGKADARIAQGLRTAFVLYDDAERRARRELRRVVGDERLQEALRIGDRRLLRARVRELVREQPQVRAVAVADEAGAVIARAGSDDAVAAASAAPTRSTGDRIGTLSVSVTGANEFVRTVNRHTGLDVRIFRGGDRMASTLGTPGGSAESGTVQVGGRRYRARFQAIPSGIGGTLELGVLVDAESVEDAITESRLLIGSILLAFVLLALMSSIFVVRALQGQMAEFLEAARRLSRGDFSRPVPVAGKDEFAALGTEFNRMSTELAAKIEEVEAKRRQLEEAIRRVGEAFAAGLDREGIVELVVRTSMDACAAEAGRAVPIDPTKMPPAALGSPDRQLRAALESAERAAFSINPAAAAELLASLDPSREQPEQRRLSVAEVDGAHALALPLRAHLGTGVDVEYVGVVSIARHETAFSEGERDLFAYLAGQALVSIENADLHETVQRQAVTDELTGLFNVRHFHEWLDDELERSRRFGTAVALVMLDLDDFKKINDTFGHQQGDEVLRAVARVLKLRARDIDEPARYGGEEMALVLPQTDLDGAELAAERLRHAIEELEIPMVAGDPSPLRVTASFGVASVPETAATKDGLIAAADAALYRAKRSGKNRVERASAAAAPS